MLSPYVKYNDAVINGIEIGKLSTEKKIKYPPTERFFAFIQQRNFASCLRLWRKNIQPITYLMFAFVI